MPAEFPPLRYIRCPQCKYDLIACEPGRACPECGQSTNVLPLAIFGSEAEPAINAFKHMNPIVGVTVLVVFIVLAAILAPALIIMCLLPVVGLALLVWIGGWLHSTADARLWLKRGQHLMTFAPVGVRCISRKAIIGLTEWSAIDHVRFERLYPKQDTWRVRIRGKKRFDMQATSFPAAYFSCSTELVERFVEELSAVHADVRVEKNDDPLFD